MRIPALLTALLAMFVSSISSPVSASLLIRIDKSAQTLTVMRDGKPLHTWPVSTGTTRYGTPSGRFTPFRMEAEHYSKEWDNAPMPHAVFFTRQGHAVHGTHHIRRLGSPASHGCVRLSPGNAARLFALVKREGLAHTQVVITGSEHVALRRMKEKQAARQPTLAVRTETDQPAFASPQPYPADDARPAFTMPRDPGA